MKQLINRRHSLFLRKFPCFCAIRTNIWRNSFVVLLNSLSHSYTQSLKGSIFLVVNYLLGIKLLRGKVRGTRLAVHSQYNSLVLNQSKKLAEWFAGVNLLQKLFFSFSAVTSDADAFHPFHQPFIQIKIVNSIFLILLLMYNISIILNLHIIFNTNFDLIYLHKNKNMICF